MNLQHRIDLLVRLEEYILSENEDWKKAKERASLENGWFIPEFVNLAVNNIATSFLQKEILKKWTAAYELHEEKHTPKLVGIVMAGNIPLVGFHDFLSVFISGHRSLIKPSSKDQVLIKHIVEKLQSWDNEMIGLVQFSEMLKNCDAYIATGSNNSSKYFDFYFSKYPHIIRRNRTSVAILTGNESIEELENLADDVYRYFGLGCRNVTKIYVPKDIDFIQMLEIFRKYSYLADYNKYKNNYDYNLALHLLNNKFYMTNSSILLIEDQAIFSPISQLNYEYYDNKEDLLKKLKKSDEIQCITGLEGVPFGSAQCPSVMDYSDGIDTIEFLIAL